MPSSTFDTIPFYEYITSKKLIAILRFVRADTYFCEKSDVLTEVERKIANIFTVFRFNKIRPFPWAMHFTKYRLIGPFPHYFFPGKYLRKFRKACMSKLNPCILPREAAILRKNLSSQFPWSKRELIDAR